MSPRYERHHRALLALHHLGERHRLYVEEAGKGIPLLCPHTAGADTRQYRGLMNEVPMSEDHEKFVSYLLPMLGKMKDARIFAVRPRESGDPGAKNTGFPPTRESTAYASGLWGQP